MFIYENNLHPLHWYCIDGYDDKSKIDFNEDHWPAQLDSFSRMYHKQLRLSSGPGTALEPVWSQPQSWVILVLRGLSGIRLSNYHCLRSRVRSTPLKITHSLLVTIITLNQIKSNRKQEEYQKMMIGFPVFETKCFQPSVTEHAVL